MSEMENGSSSKSLDQPQLVEQPIGNSSDKQGKRRLYLIVSAIIVIIIIILATMLQAFSGPNLSTPESALTSYYTAAYSFNAKNLVDSTVLRFAPKATYDAKIAEINSGFQQSGLSPPGATLSDISVEYKAQLEPTVKEVVRGEIDKFVDAGIIVSVEDYALVRGNLTVNGNPPFRTGAFIVCKIDGLWYVDALLETLSE